MPEPVLATDRAASGRDIAIDAGTGQRPAPKGRLWFSDFEFGPQGVLIRKTGWRADYSLSNILSVRSWFVFFLTVTAAAARVRRDFVIQFAPDRVRPWYLIWPVVRLAGGRIAQDGEAADVVFHFEDATFGQTAAPHARQGVRYLNFGCRDVSKSAVAKAFEAAFGYPLALDPETHQGEAVAKCELNGAHDGRIITCPAPREDGRVYQRVIDNRCEGRGLVEDFRTPTIGGKPICVFIKRRAVSERFANANSEVELRTPEECFSAAEMERIADFCARMGLDWGGLDILRDRSDGRLYIVDANKTDMGPPIALPLKDKMYAARALAAAFRRHIGR